MKKLFLIAAMLLLLVIPVNAQALDIGVICYHSITDNPLKYS